MNDEIKPELLELISQIDEGLSLASKCADPDAFASLLSVKLQALHLWNT